MPDASQQSRKPVIVTFKPKDKRSRREDKQEILRSTISSDVSFLTASEISREFRPVPLPEEVEGFGFDVNRYKAPILTARLTNDEINALKTNEDVARVEEDGVMYAIDIQREETLDLRREHAPEVMTQTIPSGVSQVKAPDAWPCSQGEGIKVFICDTGIDSDHPDLAPNVREGKSFVAGESSTEDFHGHGTHCAGTVAAALNGRGVVGVAPHAVLYPLKVLKTNGEGNWSSLIAALDWIIDKQGARIASMSLGHVSAPLAVRDMCEMVYNEGVLLVAAAGNRGPENDSVGYPAKYPHVMAVSAVDSSETIANFSSRGPEIEICGPGKDVLSTRRGGGYDFSSGTSMACPHVSGVAALAWGSHRGANNRQIRWLLDNFANKVGDQDPEKYGAGRVDANSSAFYIGMANEYEI